MYSPLSVAVYPQHSCYPGCQRFSKRRAMRRWEEKRERWENLWLPETVDWCYCANRFEVGSRSDPASWLDEPYSVLWLALIVNCQVCCYWWLLIDSRDSYRSMIVRFASPATRSLLLPLLFLSFLFAAKENLWDQGTLLLELIINFVSFLLLRD